MFTPKHVIQSGPMKGLLGNSDTSSTDAAGDSGGTDVQDRVLGLGLLS